MNAIGHPLPGDFLYHNDRSEIGRQALHSWKLEFKHPITGEEMAFEQPLPEDMRNLL
jgi:23S rRNA pseudouridine1911/1915/1917 synthase